MVLSSDAVLLLKAWTVISTPHLHVECAHESEDQRVHEVADLLVKHSCMRTSPSVCLQLAAQGHASSSAHQDDHDVDNLDNLPHTSVSASVLHDRCSAQMTSIVYMR